METQAFNLEKELWRSKLGLLEKMKIQQKLLNLEYEKVNIRKEIHSKLQKK